MGTRMRGLQRYDFGPPRYVEFPLRVFGALTTSAKFLSGQRWLPAKGVTALNSLGHKLQARNGV